MQFFNGGFPFVNPETMNLNITGKKPSRYQKTGTFRTFELNYQQEFINICANQFKWKNLPEGVTSHWIEEALITNGSLGCVYDENYGLIFGQGNYSGPQNHYGFQIYYQFTSPVIKKRFRVDHNAETKNGVVIQNDSLMYPRWITITNYAYKLAQLKNYIDINLKTTSTPFLLVARKKSKLRALKDLWNQISSGQPLVITGLDPNEDFQQVQMQNTYLVNELQQQFDSTRAEALTLLGVNNTNTEKQERMLVDEVNANNQNVAMNLSNLLSYRQEAVDLINKKFNTNIKVELNEIMEMNNNATFSSTDPTSRKPETYSKNEPVPSKDNRTDKFN